MNQLHLIYSAIARASNNCKDAHYQSIGPVPVTPSKRVSDILNGSLTLISVKARDDFGGWRTIHGLEDSLKPLEYLSEPHVAISYLDGTVTKYTNQKTIVTDNLNFTRGRWQLVSRTSTRAALLHQRGVPLVGNRRVIAQARENLPTVDPLIVQYVADQIGAIVYQVAHDQNRHLCGRSPEYLVREAFEHVSPSIQWHIENLLFEGESPPTQPIPVVDLPLPKTVTANYTAEVIKRPRKVA